MRYNGKDYMFLKDALGSITEIIDSSDGLYAQYAYDAWGNIIYKAGSMADFNPFRYRGYYMDLDTGFYYLQTRYYDPVIRRFINADDYELVPWLVNSIGGLNLYSYCNNNPVMYTDPTGQFIIIDDLFYVAMAFFITALFVSTVAYVETQTHFIENIVNDLTTGLSYLWDSLFNADTQTKTDNPNLSKEGNRGKGGETYPGEKKKSLPTWKEKDMFKRDLHKFKKGSGRKGNNNLPPDEIDDLIGFLIGFNKKINRKSINVSIIIDWGLVLV